jgi:hypothetical protein
MKKQRISQHCPNYDSLQIFYCVEEWKRSLEKTEAGRAEPDQADPGHREAAGPEAQRETEVQIHQQPPFHRGREGLERGV